MSGSLSSPACPVPESFRAYVVDTRRGSAVPPRAPRPARRDDLPRGEVTVRVEWSSVNFKDGLAARDDGKVARGYPRVPGIDLAGEVVASDDAAFRPGRPVLANGYDLGTARDGGYSEVARVPAGWVVPLPAGLTARDAMAIGTAGFTAAMSVAALEGRGLKPGDGPVLVTGASGGVGTTAIAILAGRGYEVWAATGKADEQRAPARPRRGRVPDPRRGHRPGPAAGLGALGGRGRRRGLRDAARTSCGHSAWGPRSRRAATPAGRSSSTTVFPFILRGVALLGMDSVLTAHRRAPRAVGPPGRPTCGRAAWEDGITEVDSRHARARAGRDRRRRRRAAGGSSGPGELPAPASRRLVQLAAQLGDAALDRFAAQRAAAHGAAARTSSTDPSPAWTRFASVGDRSKRRERRRHERPPATSPCPGTTTVAGPTSASSASAVAGQSIGKPSPKYGGRAVLEQVAREQDVRVRDEHDDVVVGVAAAEVAQLDLAARDDRSSPGPRTCGRAGRGRPPPGRPLSRGRSAATAGPLPLARLAQERHRPLVTPDRGGPETRLPKQWSLWACVLTTMPIGSDRQRPHVGEDLVAPGACEIRVSRRRPASRPGPGRCPGRRTRSAGRTPGRRPHARVARAIYAGQSDG